MCGIAGTFYFYDDQIVNDFTNNKIIQSLKNRGPDGHSSWTSDDKKVSLIHTRLSIFDTSENGKQPMMDCENRYLITFNGYNPIILLIRLILCITKFIKYGNWELLYDVDD